MDTVLNSAGWLAMRGVDLVISSRLTSLAVATGGAVLVVQAEVEAEADRLKPSRLPCRWTVMGAAAYGVLLTVIGTGLGRYPLTGRLVAYSVAQAVMVVADGYVISCIAVKVSLDDTQLRPTLPLAVFWFAGRLLDGWYRPSMPVNTLPWMSLISHLRAGRTFFSPLVTRLFSWGRRS
jgi:hypothetical protein